jgi:hypothetical protein
MRTALLIAALTALPGIAMAQLQTPLAPADAPHNPTATGTPRKPPAKPDQASLPNQTKSLKTKDPFRPNRDLTPEQKALPERVP